MKVLKIAIAVVLVVTVLPVWLAGVVGELMYSAFQAGRKTYSDFYNWLGGR